MNSANKGVGNEAPAEYTSPPRLDGVLTCIYCPAKFMVYESLEKHVKRNHSGRNKTGNDCSRYDSTDKTATIAPSRKLVNKKTLPDTVLSTTDNPGKCSSATSTLKEKCNDGFLEPLNAKKIKTSFKSGIKCLYCPYNHPSINNVRAHIIQAHSREVEKPKGVMVQLQSTENVQKKAMTFQLKCTKDRNCSFATHSLSSLKAHHMQKHTKTLHPCPLCVKKFTRHPDLTKHILIDHSGVPNRRQDDVKSNLTSMAEGNSISIINMSHGVALRGNQEISSQGQCSSNNSTDEYPFDFDGLKAYLKVFTCVKKIFDTTNDPQLKAEILEKDRNNLLGRREKPEGSVFSSQNQPLVMNTYNEHSVQEVYANLKGNTEQNIAFHQKSSYFSKSGVNTPTEIIMSDISPVKQVIDVSPKSVEIEQNEGIPQSKPLERRMTGKQFRSFRRAITPLPNT